MSVTHNPYELITAVSLIEQLEYIKKWKNVELIGARAQYSLILETIIFWHLFILVVWPILEAA